MPHRIVLPAQKEDRTIDPGGAPQKVRQRPLTLQEKNEIETEICDRNILRPKIIILGWNLQ